MTRLIQGIPVQIPLGPTATNFEMIWVDPDSFIMGSDKAEEDRYEDEDAVFVTLTQGFWLSKYLVTQGQYSRLVEIQGRGLRTPSLFSGLPDSESRPVDSVTWLDIVSVLRAFNEHAVMKLTLPAGFGFRLPYEAEWEFACKANSKIAPSGEDLNRCAWYASNSGGTTHPVGKKAGNALGFHDMLGNVCEWCQDVYDFHPTTPQVNWTGPANDSIVRVVKGGGWNDTRKLVRPSSRLECNVDQS